MEKNPEIVRTGDGSTTLFHPVWQEHYHSIFGAERESETVFIRAGLEQFAGLRQTIRIFEMGLGTGLNVLLTLRAAQVLQLRVFYHAVEAWPISAQLAEELSPDHPNSRIILQKIHSMPSDLTEEPVPGFFFQKSIQKVEDLVLLPQNYHLIYFDAFSPTKQPELWSLTIFQKMYSALCPGGALVTYCARGHVKRTLKEAGFQVEALPGPPGKREMTRAWKKDN